MKPITFNRKTLYELLWSETMLSITKKYDTTYHRLYKICEDLNIPRPNAGYWTKKQLGKPVIQIALPLAILGKDEVVLNLLEQGDTKTSNSKSDITEKQNDFHVPNRLSDPDKLIVAVKKYFEREAGTYRHNERHLLITYGDLVDIRVTARNVGRALRFMDSVIKFFKSKGYEIQFGIRETYFIVDGIWVQFWFREKMKRVVLIDIRGSIYNSYEYHPTNILYFKIVVSNKPIQWEDGKLPIESQLPNIFSKIEEIIFNEKCSKMETEKKWAEQKERDRIVEEKKQRQKSDKENFDKLLTASFNWHHAASVRSYIDALEAKAIANGNLTEDVIAWFEWARKKADHYDPITSFSFEDIRRLK